MVVVVVVGVSGIQDKNVSKAKPKSDRQLSTRLFMPVLSSIVYKSCNSCMCPFLGGLFVYFNLTACLDDRGK